MHPPTMHRIFLVLVAAAHPHAPFSVCLVTPYCSLTCAGPWRLCLSEVACLLCLEIISVWLSHTSALSYVS
jgi:hypothetical protein